MEDYLNYIVGPVVGAIIGYITNDIAIRMLFRPHQPKYIFGLHIPFTPGIIPKERGRIASSIGTAISENLMNRDVLEKNLLSDEMVGKVRNAIDEFFSVQKENQETVREYLGHYLSDEELEQAIGSVKDELTKLLHTKLANQVVGEKIAHVAVEHVMKKMQNFGSGMGDAFHEDGIGSGGGFGQMLSRGIESLFGKQTKSTSAEFISALAEPVERMLAKNINEMLKNNSQEIVGNLFGNEIDHLLDCKVAVILNGCEQQIEQIQNSIVSLYKSVIRDCLPKMLNAINISKIVEGRINEMDMDETERLIFAVMDRELKAIVWLGAGLGFIMGFINSFI